MKNYHPEDNFEKYAAEFRLNGITGLEKICLEIQGLREVKELTDLTYKCCVKDDPKSKILMLWYDAKAPELFPSVRQNLISTHKIRDHNIISTSRIEKNTDAEVYNIILGFYGAKFQLFIDFKKK